MGSHGAGPMTIALTQGQTPQHPLWRTTQNRTGAALQTPLCHERHHWSHCRTMMREEASDHHHDASPPHPPLWPSEAILLTSHHRHRVHGGSLTARPARRPIHDATKPDHHCVALHAHDSLCESNHSQGRRPASSLHCYHHHLHLHHHHYYYSAHYG